MRYTLLFVVFAAIVGCRSHRQVSAAFPRVAYVQAETLDLSEDNVAVSMGGYGSSMAYDASDSCFYLLTDRGPNVDGTQPESKVFPVPGYSPTIGRFRLHGDSLVLVGKIVLCESDGTPFNGLPNSRGDGITGETGYDLKGVAIENNARGIDPEGLAMAPDGTFWVSDEYGPFIMQFDRTGRLIREIKPSHGLPAYFAKRRPNRGMEGLAISRDGTKLYGIMQSPLYLPDASTKGLSVNNRIVEIDLCGDSVREYLYRMDSPGNVVSEIICMDDTTLLVLERDDKFPKNGQGVKRVYRVDLRGASDIAGDTIEMLSAEELQLHDIIPLGKQLFVDILEEVPAYSHDKPEGIDMIGDSILCIINDDDFGITVSGDGKYLPKTNAEGGLDKTEIYFIPVSMRSAI